VRYPFRVILAVGVMYLAGCVLFIAAKRFWFEGGSGATAGFWGDLTGLLVITVGSILAGLIVAGIEYWRRHRRSG
jgi:hypothetical protein